jgi:hypothetical protein
MISLDSGEGIRLEKTIIHPSRRLAWKKHAGVLRFTWKR